MATIRTNTNNTYYAVLTLTEGSYNIEDNTSPVRYSLVLYNGIQNFSGYTIGYEIVINGVQVAYQNNSGNQTSMSANSSKTVATGSTTITHDTDGSKSISASVRIWTNNMSYLPVSLSGSGSMTLATIPRASTPTLSASSFNAGSALTITTNRASSSFTHTLTYTLNGSTGTIATGVGASYTWAAASTKALAGLIPNVTSGIMTITCYTYSGSTHIGTKTVNVTVNVPATSDFMPTVSSVSVADANGYATRYNGYVQGKSAPTVTISATANYSTIKSYKVEFQGIAVTGASNVVSLATVTSTGSLNIVTTATDGRGRAATKTETIEALTYNSPTVSARVVRCKGGGTDNDEGAFMKVSCSAEVVALNDVNSKDIALQYRQKGAANWTTEKTWKTYIVSEDVVIAADIDHSYDIQLVATDDFATATFGAELGTVAVTIDYHETGKGIAIGKVSEGEGFEVDWDTKFNKDVEVDGKLTVGGRPLFPAPITVTTAETDLNDYLIDGWYFFYDSSVTPMNIPAGVNGWLQVISQGDSDGFTKQIWYRAGTRDTNDFHTFVRTKYKSDPWSTWKTVLTNGTVKDYTVEEGTNGIWSYRKSNNGVVECWCRTAINNINFETAIFGGYECSVVTLNLPEGLLKTIINCHTDIVTGNSCFVSYNAWNTSIVNIKGVNSVKGAKNITCTCSVKGTWK